LIYCRNAKVHTLKC